MSAFQEELTVFEWPSTLDADTLKMCIVSLLSRMRGPASPPDVTLQQTVLLFSLAVPEIAKQVRTMKSVTVKVVKVDAGELARTAGVDNGTAPRYPIPYKVSFDPESLTVTDLVAAFAGVASVMFAYARQVNESGAVRSYSKRPQALIQRFQIPEDQQLILPGKSLGPSREYLDQVYQTYQMYSEARYCVTSGLILVKDATDHYPPHIEAIMTNLRLMEGSGMTHVGLIIKLLRSHPWIIKVPKLVPAVASFVGDLQALEKKSYNERAFHRLLAAQNKFLFLAQNLRPLTAVATGVLQDVDTTLQSYTGGVDQYQDLVDEVKAMAGNYKPTAAIENIRKALGLPDVAVPEHSTTTPSSTPVVP